MECVVKMDELAPWGLVHQEASRAPINSPRQQMATMAQLPPLTTLVPT